MSILVNRALNVVESMAQRAGVTLLKNSRYEQEWNINGALLAEAAHAERERRGLKGVGGTGIVFSFNRPVQLHLLLNSYFLRVKNPVPLVVQYGAKGEGFEQAYKDVAKMFPQVTFVREKGFKETLMRVLGEITTNRMFFLVDDDVFTREVDLARFCAFDPLEVVPSLRLAPTLSYSYTVGVKQGVPEFRTHEGAGDMLAFTWGDETNEWNYPMSVEGHLFDTAEITVMSRVLNYKAPNTYEGLLMRFAPVVGKRTGLCFAQPKIMNIPCNMVQTEVANKAGDVSPEELLGRWNAGEIIDPLPFADYPNVSPHEEVGFVFKKASAAKDVKAKADTAPARTPQKAVAAKSGAQKATAKGAASKKGKAA